MNGQRTNAGSFSQQIAFDQGSSSSNSGGAQQHCLNMPSPIGNRLPDYLASCSDGDVISASAVPHEARSLNIWGLGESSNNENPINQITHEEVKSGDGWPLSLINGRAASELEERHDEATGSLSLGSVNLSRNLAADGQLSLRNSRVNNIPQRNFLNMQNWIGNGGSDYLASDSDRNIISATAVSQAENLSLRLGESSSNENMINQIPRREGWPSSITSSGVASRFEERRIEATNNLSLGSIHSRNQPADRQISLQGSRANNIPLVLNLNSTFMAESDGGAEGTESGISSHQYQPGGSETGRIHSTGCSSDPNGDDRPGCSSDGRRLSCKRKTLEGGDLSLNGNSNAVHSENNIQHAAPAHGDATNNSSSMSATAADSSVALDLFNQQFGTRMRAAASISQPTSRVTGAAESSQRNSRMRVNPSYQQEFAPFNLSSGNTMRHSSVSLPVQQATHIPQHPLFDIGLPASASSAFQSHVIHPGLQPFPWNAMSTSRAGSSAASSVINGERPFVLQDEVRPSHTPSTISQHPMFYPVAGMRNLPQDPRWILANANAGVSGNPGPTFRVGSSSGVNGSFAPTWVPYYNSAIQYPQQLSEIRTSLQLPAVSEIRTPLQLPTISEIRTALQLPAISEFPGLVRPAPLLARSRAPTLLQEMGNQGHHQTYPTPALRSNRQRGGASSAVQAMSASAEERRRLLTEIRTVLTFIRRGGNLNLEEFANNLTRSAALGAADLNDRHRDMRLEIDNMSYEELLALEERIGNVKTGLDEDTIVAHMKQRKFSPNRDEVSSEVEPCCICQEEYLEGVDIGVLDCRHIFHAECIQSWLKEKNLCPICKKKALAAGERN